MENTQGARDPVLLWNRPHFSWGEDCSMIKSEFTESSLQLLGAWFYDKPRVHRILTFSWGDGNEKRDWALAAKKAGDLVLQVASTYFN